MCSRLLAATLAVLIGSTAEVGATLIVVYRSDSEVVIAADSRGNTERGTHKDDFCKIWDYGDLVFAHSGTHQTGAFSISAILDGGVLGPGSSLVPWSRIERFIPIVNTGLIGARLSYQDAHFVGVFAYRTEGALVTAFTPTALPRPLRDAPSTLMQWNGRSMPRSATATLLRLSVDGRPRPDSLENSPAPAGTPTGPTGHKRWTTRWWRLYGAT